MRAAVMAAIFAIAASPAAAQQFKTPAEPTTKGFKIDPPTAQGGLVVTSPESGAKITQIFGPPIQGWSLLTAPPRGRAVCGGVRPDGMPQPACSSKAGIRVGEPLRQCPKDAFARPKGTKTHCYACPVDYKAVYLAHDNTAVRLNHACYKETGDGEDHAKASFVSKLPLNERTLCTGDSFFVDANGGECWTCPDGMRRTVQDAEGPKACRKGVTGVDYAPAKFVNSAPKKCPAGQFWSARGGGECWSCQAEYRRTALALTGDKACAQKRRVYSEPKQTASLLCGADGQFMSERGNVCLACPRGYERNNWRGKLGENACSSLGIEWQSPPFPDPGFFGLSGAEGAAAGWLADPRAFSQFLALQAKAHRIADVKGAIESVWQEAASVPQASKLFLAFAYVQTLDRVIGGPLNDHETAFLRNFSTYVTARRTFMAQEALYSYLEWKKAADARQKATETQLAGLLHLEPEPPDMDKIVVGTALTAFETAGIVYAVLVPLKAARVPAQIARYGSQLAKLSAAGTVMGPLVVITIAAEIGIRATIQATKAALAQPKLEAALHKAKQPIDFQRLTRTPEGIQQVALYWSQAIANANAKARPQFLAHVKAAWAKAKAANYYQ
jgi:hypothetical protein